MRMNIRNAIGLFSALALIGAGAVILREAGQDRRLDLGNLAPDARGDVLLFADADGATPIDEEAGLAEAIRAGADLAVGSRLVIATEEKSSQLYLCTADSEQAGLLTFTSNFLVEFQELIEQAIDNGYIVMRRRFNQRHNVVRRNFKQKRLTEAVRERRIVAKMLHDLGDRIEFPLFQ